MGQGRTVCPESQKMEKINNSLDTQYKHFIYASFERFFEALSLFYIFDPIWPHYDVIIGVNKNMKFQKWSKVLYIILKWKVWLQRIHFLRFPFCKIVFDPVWPHYDVIIGVDRRLKSEISKMMKGTLHYTLMKGMTPENLFFKVSFL